MNPLDLRGPQFLALYILLLVVAVVVAAVLRWLLRAPAGEPPLEALALSPYEVAYLAGGETLAIDAAIVSLIHRNVLSFDVSARTLAVKSQRLPPESHELEEVVFHAANEEASIDITSARARAQAAARKLRLRLQERDLMVADDHAFFVRTVPGLPLLGLAVLGVAKIRVGLSRHRPVEFLVLLVVLTVLIALWFFARRPLRTRRGDRALAQLKRENAALESAAGRWRGRELTDGELLLALGLFGMGVLAGGPLAELQTVFKPPVTASSSGCGSSCGGGCGSGCGGGCGGGGCGGCGG